MELCIRAGIFDERPLVKIQNQMNQKTQDWRGARRLGAMRQGHSPGREPRRRDWWKGKLVADTSAFWRWDVTKDSSSYEMEPSLLSL